MKIILATSMGGLGGTETASLRLGSLLARHRHDVLLAASDGPLVSDAQAAGMRWQNIDFYGLFAFFAVQSGQYGIMGDGGGKFAEGGCRFGGLCCFGGEGGSG